MGSDLAVDFGSAFGSALTSGFDSAFASAFGSGFGSAAFGFSSAAASGGGVAGRRDSIFEKTELRDGISINKSCDKGLA
ncbi:MAG: hypothetical protein EBU75_01075 [Betaproteobacteria bacterium]|nr:hypothetical protein [Betaproteobacteria bacterium]